ncbi:MAG: aminotransferase class V-fold PLP-dependent enzyme [Treponemataceae bacterium]|nr:MAG: aminotransferase class V-fold PLP-dependent enzyme [Treponemataceae bacterium]
MQFSTQLIHSGCDIDEATGALGVPVYQSSTFDQKLPQNGETGGVKREFDYARSGNPTRKALENTIARLEAPAGIGAARGFAFGSGIAAVSSVLGIFAAGDHIVTAEDIYGGSYRMLNTFFARWGLENTAVDTSNPENIARAVQGNTKAVFLETPSNPLLKITDLRACAKIAHDAGLITIVDNTFMTPYLQRPLELGCDIVIHSATKFLGGHSDVVLGLAVTKTEELGKRVYAVLNGFGAIAAPWDSWLVLRGIKTLKVRMEAEQETARFLASALRESDKIDEVFYPGEGAVLSFKTKTKAQAERFLSTVKLAAYAVSLGGVETIASYPVKMSHAAMPPAERERLGITDTLIRISCGLEDAQDLWEDFSHALQ